MSSGTCGRSRSGREMSDASGQAVTEMCIRDRGILWKTQKRSASMNKKDRIHDWRKLKWPFTATFLYYSLLSLYTGTAAVSYTHLQSAQRPPLPAESGDN